MARSITQLIFLDMDLAPVYLLSVRVLIRFFQCALDQLFAFCANKVLETKVAGKMASDMCRAAARVSIRKYQQLG